MLVKNDRHIKLTLFWWSLWLGSSNATIKIPTRRACC